MNLLRLIPACRALEAMTTESSIARVKAESENRDLRDRITTLQDDLAAVQKQLAAKQEQILEDRTRMMDWLCVAQRLAPIFHRVEDLPAPPPMPEPSAHQVSRPRAEHIVAEFENDFYRAVDGSSVS